MFVSMATSATLILVFRVEEGGSRAVGYVVVAFICFFMFFFAYGWGWVKFSGCRETNIKLVFCHVMQARDVGCEWWDAFTRSERYVGERLIQLLSSLTYCNFSVKFLGIAVSLTGSTYWVGNIIVAQVTPLLLASPLRTFGTFYLLVGVHVAAMLFVLLTLPETKVHFICVMCYECTVLVSPWDTSPHLLVTLVQPMRPGVSHNTSCAVGDIE